jgi:hypothetical protein
MIVDDYSAFPVVTMSKLGYGEVNEFYSVWLATTYLDNDDGITLSSYITRMIKCSSINDTRFEENGLFTNLIN